MSEAVVFNYMAIRDGYGGVTVVCWVIGSTGAYQDIPSRKVSSYSNNGARIVRLCNNLRGRAYKRARR